MHPITRRRFTAAASFSLAGLGHLDQTVGDAPSFHSTTNLVLLEVSVTDGSGVPVAGLEKEDFQIKESGRPRSISSFATGAEQFCAGLVIDFSRSMRAHQATVAMAAQRFQSRLEPRDELFLVLFNESIIFESTPERMASLDPRAISRRIATTNPDGQTGLYDALRKATTIASHGENSRRVLILLSDGEDTASTASMKDAVETIESTNQLIYAIGMFESNERPPRTGVLRRLAETTGGLTEFDPNPGQLTAFFDRVTADLRARYVLGFLAEEPPPGRKETRKLKVELANRTYKKSNIRTRRQYRIESTGN